MINENYEVDPKLFVENWDQLSQDQKKKVILEYSKPTADNELFLNDPNDPDDLILNYLRNTNSIPVFKPMYMDTLFSVEGTNENWSK